MNEQRPTAAAEPMSFEDLEASPSTVSGSASGPYVCAANAYYEAGWRGILPIPLRQKALRLKGYTGRNGRDPSYPDLRAWIEERPDSNIALHMPRHLDYEIIGIDVDAYSGKAGRETLDALEAQLGELPPTWRSTSRDDGTSGIRFYRVPKGLRWPTTFGAGIDSVTVVHRYAVVAPSVHPEGRTYRWIHPQGMDQIGVVPRPGEMAQLPDTWVQHFTGGALDEDRPKAYVSNEQARSWLQTHGQGAPCRAVADATAKALTAMASRDGEARHDVMLRLTRALVLNAAEGHTGVLAALDDARRRFVAVTAADRGLSVAETEFDRAVEGAVAEAITRPDTPADDPCDNPLRQLDGILKPEDQTPFGAQPSETPPGTPAAAGLIESAALADTEALTAAKQPDVLTFMDMKQLRAVVKAAGPRRWLLRGIIPAGDYGVHGAEPKAGKTWNTADLAIAVASGTPWLGLVEVDAPGPVLMFIGEGGQGNTLRRLDAAAKARGLNLDDLAIVVCTRAPHLNDLAHMAQFEQQINVQRPVLVTLDPLYLSARGAELGDLYKMGELLEGPQRICQSLGASLFVVTHFNRQAGTGARRLTGAGPAEWGRFLITANVTSRRADDRGGTRVVTKVEVIGGEIADHAITLDRRVWADDPNDLDSPLHTETRAQYADEHEDTAGDGTVRSELTPAAAKLLEAMDTLGVPASSKELVDTIFQRHGHGLRRETVSRELNQLEDSGVVEHVEKAGESGRWPAKLWARRALRDPV